jgi:hypothetical protein
MNNPKRKEAEEVINHNNFFSFKTSTNKKFCLIFVQNCKNIKMLLPTIPKKII